ncbi:hypothetical protein [Oceanithermus sp.]
MLVYLDQNYASRIAKHLLALPGQEAFGEVWAALRALGGRAVVPPSPFHVLELHGGYLLPTFRRMFARINQGWWVRPWPDVARRQAEGGSLEREDFLWRRGSWTEPADLAPLWGLLDLELEGDFYQRTAAARSWARQRLGLGRGDEAAPFFPSLGRLVAFLSLERERGERASDLVDVVMAATVVPYADALATDRYLREALVRTGLNAGRHICSGRAAEVRRCARWLQGRNGT